MADKERVLEPISQKSINLIFRGGKTHLDTTYILTQNISIKQDFKFYTFSD